MSWWAENNPFASQQQRAEAKANDQFNQALKENGGDEHAAAVKVLANNPEAMEMAKRVKEAEAIVPQNAPPAPKIDPFTAIVNYVEANEPEAPPSHVTTPHHPVGNKPIRAGHIVAAAAQPHIEHVAGHVSEEIVRETSKKYGIEMEGDSIVSDKVKDLQHYLGMEGAARDGKLGPDTEKKMLDYAKNNNLDVSDPSKIVDEIIAKNAPSKGASQDAPEVGHLPPPPTPGRDQAASRSAAAGR